MENPDGLTAKAEVTVKTKPNDTTDPDNSGNNGSHNNNNGNDHSNSSNGADKEENHQGAVETGDSFGMMMWTSLLAILVSVGIIVVYFLRRKNRR